MWKAMQAQLLPMRSSDDYSLAKWIIAPCNELASKWVIQGADAKMSRMGYIYGESGKTHLSHIFAQLLCGRVASCQKESPRQLFLEGNVAGYEQEFTEREADRNSTIKIDAIAIDPVENFSEKWLFDAFNILRENNSWALFTSRLPASHFELLDLRSRMMSIPSFHLGAPDDHMIKCVIAKRLKDFGALVDDGTLTYLLARIPRSFAAVNEWAERLNTYSSIHKCRISKHVIRILLQGGTP
jgi:chromosomal replication initiation ATPase DnaA